MSEDILQERMYLAHRGLAVAAEELERLVSGLRAIREALSWGMTGRARNERDEWVENAVTTLLEGAVEPLALDD